VRTPYGREGVSKDMVKEISLTGTMDQEKGEGGEERREIHSVVRGDPLYISNIWRSLDILSSIRFLHMRQIGLAGGIGVPCQAFHNPSS
jgi:hypothetical protein